LITELKGGSSVDPKKLTVREHLENWLEHVQAHVTPKTLERYKGVVRGHLIPSLGSIKLTELQPVQISAMLAKAATEGRKDGRGGLSPASVLYQHRLLKEALTVAVSEWRLISWNPSDGVKPPRLQRRKMAALTAEQTATLIDTARPYRLFIPVLLAVTAGLRRGEVCALRWRHADLTEGRLAVVESTEQTKAGTREKAPKSGRGRLVTLTPLAIEALRRHKAAQADELAKLEISQTNDTHIAAQADGQPLKPNSLTHEFVRFVAGKKLPKVRFHDLRHTHASHMLAGNVHPKIVQERLGHASVAITLDIYSHAIPTLQQSAALTVDDALQAALDKRRNEEGGKKG
jgi:integrase